MAGKKRSTTGFPNITRSQFAEILERARKTRYVQCPYLAMRDASLIAFEFLFKTRVSESVGSIFPEDREDRERSKFLDKYDGIRLNDFDIGTVKGREVLRCGFRVLKRGCRKKICESCGERNGLKSSYCRECGSTLDKIKYDSRLKEHYVWGSVRLDDPFARYIIEWLSFLQNNPSDPNPSMDNHSAESVADLQKLRNNEPYTTTLESYTISRYYGSIHLKGGSTSGNDAF